MAVEKIPQGFHTVTPYVVFKDTKAAIELYKKALGATVDSVLTSPDGKKVMHACLNIGNSKIFMGDENPNMKAQAPGPQGSSVSFYLYVDDVDAAHKKAVAAGLKDIMAPADMFWGDKVGAVADPYGYHWSIATKVRDVSEDEIKRASLEACKNSGKAA